MLLQDHYLKCVSLIQWVFFMQINLEVHCICGECDKFYHNLSQKLL